MVDIETIGIAMDTSGLVKGQAALSAAEKAANKTADAADRVGSSSKVGFKAAGDAAEKAQQQIDRMSLSAVGGVNLLKGAIGGLVASLSIRALIQMADAATMLESRLKLVTTGTQQLITVQTQLYQIAQSARVSYTELGSTYAQIARSTQELGLSQARLLGVTKTISQAITISGGSAQGTSAAMVQLTQGFASGTLRGEELNSVMEQTPRLAQAIAQGLGISIGKLREMGQAGKLTAEAVMSALEASASGVNAEFGKVAVTVSGAGTMASNSLTALVGQIDRTTGASSVLAGAISTMATGFDKLGGVIERNQTLFAGIGGALGGAALIGGIYAASTAIGVLSAAVVVLGGVMLANPLVLAVLGIGAVAGGGMAVYGAFKKTTEGIEQTNLALIKQRDIIEKNLASGRLDTQQREANLQTLGKVNAQLKDNNAQLAVGRAGVIDSSAEDARLQRGTAANTAAKKAAEELAGIRQKLSGVDKDYIPTLEKLAALRDSGAVSDKDYISLVSDLAAKTYKKTDASKAGANADRDAADAANDYITKLKEEAESAGLSEQQVKMLAAARAAAVAPTAALRMQIMLQAVATDFAVRAGKEALAMAEANIAANKELLDAEYKRVEAHEKSLPAMLEQNNAMRDEIEMIGLDALGILAITQARQSSIIAIKEEQLARMQNTEIMTRAEIALAEEIRLLKEKQSLTGQKQVGEYNFKEQEDARKRLEASLDPAKAQTFGDALKGAFGGAADAAGRLSSVVQAYGIKQAEIDRDRADAATAYGSDSEKLAKAQTAIASKELTMRLGAYGDMAGAAQGFFDRGSRGYAIMGAASKAMHTAEIALQLASIAPKLAAGAASMFGQSGWGGFAGVAAMGAVMAGLGVAMSGSSGGSAASSADRQKAQGTGTVLGDSAAKSASLLNALEAMESNTFTQLKYSSGMLDALQSIQRSMAGLAQIIFRTNGLTSGNPFNIAEGTVNSNKNPLLDAIGAPTLESLFGITNSKVKKTISDSGIGINGSLADLTRGRGFDQYQDVRTDSSKYFGLVKRSSTSTQRSALDQDVANQLGAVFAGISTSLQIATTGFGRDADTIAAQLAASVISIPAVSLRGLKGAELQEALNAVFSGAADKLARTVSPGFEALQKAGEGYYETVIRASNALATANGWMERLDQKLFGVSTSGAIAATSLADLFGGINEFNAASQQFYNDYFTDAERAAQSTREMAQALGTVNLALPGSKDELRALAGTLDLTSDSGRKAYAVLLAIAPEYSATAELIARAAKDTSDRLLKAFTTDAVDFAGLRTALAGQTTDVFVNVLGSVFDQLAGRIKAAIDGIANERAAVRDAALQINNPGMRSRGEIAGDIAGSQIDSPSNARATSAINALRDAQTGQKYLQGVVDNFAKGVEYWTAKSNALASENAALNVGWYSQNLKLWGGYLATANTFLGAAVTEAREAQLSYASALQNFTIDASKAVGRLGKLREETTAYYQAQKQLADLMGNSARGLRDTVRITRIGQLDSNQSLVQKQADFAKNYSLALSTTGAAQAGYADKLAGALPDLNTALMDVARTREEWAIAASGALAQSEKIAALLEANAPKDYAADSLAMLGQIDATLSALDQSSKSAEKIISDAVNAGSDKTANGLRAVLAALTGQAIPAFALGGTFAGGLRVVGENGPELEATGPSRIYNAAQTRSLLGGGGGNTARLEALVEKLTREVEGLRFEARATATHTSTAAGLLKRVTQDGDAITTRVAV